MAALILASLAAGAAAQILGSCPILPVTTVELQPVYYSEVIPYNTVIDPFRNGTKVTISVAPTTLAISAYLTSTIFPGTTTTTTTTATTNTAELSTTTPANSTATTSVSASTVTSFTNTTSSLSTSSTSASASSTASLIPSPGGCILNTTSGNTQSEIAAAINQWYSDVVFVNGFLESADNYTTSDQKRQAAEAAYTRAVDEPCQFATIQNAATIGGLNNDPSYTCARDDLADVFPGGVLGNLQAIINNPDEFTVRAEYININRCCRVLPDLDILFQEANSIYPGAQPQPNSVNVPVPRTCEDVSCSDNTGLSPCFASKR